VVFGIMNEPHDLDIGTWASTVQEVVTAIRGVATQGHMILLPGTDFTAVGSFISSGSSSSLQAVTNPDGSTTNLIFDVHQYLDNDGGVLDTCVWNGIDGGLADLATWLRSSGRQAWLTETGGGSTPSCLSDVCAELNWMTDNGDVYLGWVAWAAGSFEAFPSYPLGLTPTFENNGWQDAQLTIDCVMGMFNQ